MEYSFHKLNEALVHKVRGVHKVRY